MPMPTTVNGLPVRTGSWEPAEDRALAEWQGQLGNRWAAVAKHIPGRTGQQCAQRWRHRVNPDIRKEKWTEQEDNNLIQLVSTHGSCWAEIARGMAGRTDQQCMGRWRRHLDPAISRAPWSPGEDGALGGLVARHGSQWSRISRAFRGRTAQQCRARWFQLEATVDDEGFQQLPAPVVTPEAPAHSQKKGRKRPAAGSKRSRDTAFKLVASKREVLLQPSTVASARPPKTVDCSGGPFRSNASSRSTATAAGRDARRSSLMTTAANHIRPPGASPLGGSSESELTNGGGCAVRRRLTLDSHEEGDEEDEAGVGEGGRPQPQLPCAWRRGKTQECAQAVADVAELTHCSDSGEEGWQPLFATPQRGKRTRLSDAPAAQPEAGAAAPDEQAHAAGVVTCAAATATTPAHAAGAALDAAPEPQPQQTPDLVKTALLPSPASSARERRGVPPLQCTPERQAKAHWEASAPSSSEKCLVSPTQEWLMAQTLFATPVRLSPPSQPSPNGVPPADNITASVAAGGSGPTCSPLDGGGGQWRLSPSHSIWALLESPAGGGSSREALRSPTAFHDFASPERETSRLGSIDGSAKRPRLGIGPCDGSGGPVVRPPVVRRLLVDGPGFSSSGGGGGAPGMPPGGTLGSAPACQLDGFRVSGTGAPCSGHPGSPVVTAPAPVLGPEAAALLPPADAAAPAPAGASAAAAAASSAAAPGGRLPGGQPPPAAQQVQHYALVHPRQFATLETLRHAIHTSMAASAGLPAARQPSPARGPADGSKVGACRQVLDGRLPGGILPGGCSGAAGPIGMKATGSNGSAAARSRLNALLEGV